MRKVWMICVLSALSANAYTNPLSESDWGSIAMEKGLDPFELYAVSLMESSKYCGNKTISPWPLAINSAGKSMLPQTHAEALQSLEQELDKGIRSIDIGLMQVNIKWHGHRVRDIRSLFDANVNLRIGADILAEAIRSEPSDRALGLGRYHAGYGNEPERLARAYHYGKRTLAIAKALRAYFGD
ncbi:transglycosylase SLT domain-containing protein (plasmid) [Methylomonas sp. MS20]|uniref:transglycosylase SLT domain-containing protein n=1 Tax=Methylomonas sp. MS20 TaxID=3418769 RepID=UPI003D01E07A